MFKTVTPFHDGITITNNLRRILKMSCLQNEMLLESIFEEVQEAFPYLDEAKQIEIAQQRFDDLGE